MENNSNAKWIIIAIVGTLSLCLIVLCATVVLVRWSINQVMAQSPTSEAIIEVVATPTIFVPHEEIPSDMVLAFETKELLNQTIVPENDRIELSERLRGISNIPRILAEDADPIPVGTIETFWVGDVDTIEHSQIKAELVYAGDYVYFWIETGVDYDLDDVGDLVDDFEARAYPINRRFFGNEWSPGIDGDEHLYILYTRGMGSAVAGYYSSADELSPLANEYSNGHEMFYLSADNIQLWDEYTYGVLAHEFQHMIHWSRDRNEESWMNEGFSELAAHLSGFDVGGWDYVYASDPDIPLTYWPTNGGPHYGQAFLFMTYFLDRFGEEATKAVVANPTNGLASLDQTLLKIGEEDPISGAIGADDVYRDWALAMLLQDPSQADGKFGYQSYSPPVVTYADEFSDCNLEPQSREVSQYGVDYIHLDCEGDFTLRFDGSPTVPVLPGEPYSGEFSFWSNRGDESDITLTRSFDFRDVETPIELSYWVWYDIEEGWDYVYLEASTDGGETWDILTTPSGNDQDLSGNSYGWAYSGMSGGDDLPTWIQERVNLTEFAGEEVLLRFEYITDAAVNGDGLLLDDVRVDVIDYAEDFEADDGGWEAAGFVRLYNRIPQTYQLVLVEHGDITRITELSLDELQHAEVPIRLGDEFYQATLVVIGTARHTWQSAPYVISIGP
jgi:immune inhibitor A